MDKKIQSYFEEMKEYKKVFEKLEQEMSIGFNTVWLSKPNKVMQTSEKTYTMHIGCTSKRHKITNSKIMRNLDVTLMTKRQKKKPTTLYDKNTQMCYNSQLGYFDRANNEKANQCYMVDAKGEDDLETQYNERVTCCDEIGKKYGFNASDYYYSEYLICLKIAYEHVKYIHGSEHVTDDEVKYINGAVRGGLMYAKEGIYKNFYKYDVNSMHPFMMQKFKFPLNVGTRKRVDKVEKFGIYYIKILEADETNLKYPFYRAFSGYFSNDEIDILDALGIKYKVSTKKSAIIWNDNELINGCDVFYYMNDLFKMRKSNAYAKSMLQVTWGSLSKTRESTIHINDISQEKYNQLKADDQILCIDFETKLMYLKHNGHTFKHTLGRLKPFLLSHIRKHMITKLLKPLIDCGYDIVQINTDGFITNCLPEKMNEIYTIGQEMGQLKIEKVYKDFQVFNVKKILEV